MKQWLFKINTEAFLRAGLGLMYLYSGYDLFANPQHWYGFVPQWFSRLLVPTYSVSDYLAAQGVIEFIIGLVFLNWFLPRSWVRFAAALAALEMLLILMLIGVDPITFRDIGLLGAAVALLTITLKEDGAGER